MTVAVVLIDADPGDVSVSPAAVPQLGRLGVTHVRVVGDERGCALVLEGWAFDVASAAEAALLLGRSPGRLLRPVMDVAISDGNGGLRDA